jgi:hypothetical protein
MGKILEIKEKVPQTAILPDGMYIGLWSGNIITVVYNGKTFELTTEEGVRGVNYKVVVSIKDGIPTFNKLNN